MIMVDVTILSPRDPIPIYSGLLERIYQLATALGRNHDVAVLYPDEPSRRDEPGRVPELQPFERVGIRNRFIETLDEVVPGYSPWRGLYKTHPWLYWRVRHYIRKWRPAVLVVEMPFLAPVALAATRGLDTPVILSEHNVQFKVTERLGIRGTRPLKRFEIAVANRVDTVLTVSEADRQALAKAVSAPIRVAPNGVDINRFHPRAASDDIQTTFDHDPLFVYHGNLGNAQNREAVNRLCDELFPRLRERLPDAGLVLVGPNPPPVSDPGVHVTGLVDDLPAYVATADVAIVPLRSGSGTKLKVLECLAAGTPVVTTPIGAEGLPLENGETALIGTTDDELIDATVRLVEDSKLHRQLSTAGRSLAEAEFGWTRTLEPYAHLVSELIDP